MGYQTATHGSLGLPCGLYQFMSLTEGKAQLFESKLVLYPTFCSPLDPYPPHAPPTNLISRERGLEFCFWPKQMDIVISTSKLSSAKHILTKQLASDSFVAEDGSGRL